jgi:hypothetical protein
VILSIAALLLDAQSLVRQSDRCILNPLLSQHQRTLRGQRACLGTILSSK